MNPFKALFKAARALMRIKNRTFYQKGGFLFVISGMFGQTVTFIRKERIAVRYLRRPLWLKPFGRVRLVVKTQGKRPVRRSLYAKDKIILFDGEDI